MSYDSRVIKVSHEEEILVQRIRQLRSSGLIRFVTLDLIEWSIVKKWSDAIELFSQDEKQPS